MKPNCGSRTAGGFLFFARAKKRNQKKARPGAREVSLRSSPHRALDQLAGRTLRASGSTRSRLKAPGGAAVLGARYGVLNNTFPLPELD